MTQHKTGMREGWLAAWLQLLVRGALTNRRRRQELPWLRMVGGVG